LQIADYCRQVETYLCQKNDGHLIRITGPSFDLVSAWAERGVPIRIAFRGIDRYFGRYYAKGPRRRPVRIDFCEADVLDLFDEWRRATGVVIEGGSAGDGGSEHVGQSRRRTPSLAAHVKRALMRLSTSRATGTLDAGFDDLLDRVAAEVDHAAGARGVKREAVLARLEALDRELIDRARSRLDRTALAILTSQAEEELAGFRPSMTGEAFARARAAAIDRLLRERTGLPVLVFS
jgi:hypothetical protein